MNIHLFPSEGYSNHDFQEVLELLRTFKGPMNFIHGGTGYSEEKS